MYYNIKLSYDPKIIGVKNGVYQVELIENKYEENFLKLFNSYFRSLELSIDKNIPNFNINFYFKKFKMTKDTSFMSFCPYLNNCHFLVNETICNILKNFNIQSYRLYSATIFDKFKIHEDYSYKMFFSILQDWVVIDFDNTIFTSGGFGNNPLNYHKFNNYTEFTNFNSLTNITTLGLNKNFDSTLDLFHTRLGGMFISERLKSALEREKASGVSFLNNVEVIV